jgi:long-chain fatty acid transport protein
VKDTPTYWIPRIGLKAGFGEAVDCLVDYSEPWGVHTDPGRDWMGANDNIQTKVTSHSYAATCSYKFQAGPGQMRFLGGFFYQELSGFKERLVAPVPTLTGSNLFGNGIGRLDLSGNGTGWRLGTAYEIPEIALRASLVYNSEVRLDDITGALDLTQVPAFIDGGNPLLGEVTPVFGSATIPQTLKLSLQSGFAPDWLAFGSVEWIQWSKLKSIAFCPEATRAIACTPGGPTEATSLDLIYRDGWTIQGGVGHKFNEELSGGASITWDRGTSTGLGYQSDTWTLGLGASYTPTPNVELRLAGALGLMTSGSSGAVEWDGRVYGDEVSYTFRDDLVSAISANVKVRW